MKWKKGYIERITWGCRPSRASRKQRRCHSAWMMTLRKQLLRPASFSSPRTSLRRCSSPCKPSQVTPPARVILRLSPASQPQVSTQSMIHICSKPP